MYSVWGANRRGKQKMKQFVAISPVSVLLFLETASFFAWSAAPSSSPANTPTSWPFPHRGEHVTQGWPIIMPHPPAHSDWSRVNT